MGSFTDTGTYPIIVDSGTSLSYFNANIYNGIVTVLSSLAQCYTASINTTNMLVCKCDNDNVFNSFPDISLSLASQTITFSRY